MGGGIFMVFRVIVKVDDVEYSGSIPVKEDSEYEEECDGVEEV